MRKKIDIKEIKKRRLLLLEKEAEKWWRTLPVISNVGISKRINYGKKYYPNTPIFLNSEQILNIYIKEKINSK